MRGDRSGRLAVSRTGPRIKSGRLPAIETVPSLILMRPFAVERASGKGENVRREEALGRAGLTFFLLFFLRAHGWADERAAHRRAGVG